VAREGRKRKRSRHWTPAGGEPTSLRDLKDSHLANIRHMLETGEVRAVGNTLASQVSEGWRKKASNEWLDSIIEEQKRRVRKLYGAELVD